MLNKLLAHTENKLVFKQVNLWVIALLPTEVIAYIFGFLVKNSEKHFTENSKFLKPIVSKLTKSVLDRWHQYIFQGINIDMALSDKITAETNNVIGILHSFENEKSFNKFWNNKLNTFVKKCCAKINNPAQVNNHEKKLCVKRLLRLANQIPTNKKYYSVFSNIIKEHIYSKVINSILSDKLKSEEWLNFINPSTLRDDLFLNKLLIMDLTQKSLRYVIKTEKKAIEGNPQLLKLVLKRIEKLPMSPKTGKIINEFMSAFPKKIKEEKLTLSVLKLTKKYDTHIANLKTGLYLYKFKEGDLIIRFYKVFQEPIEADPKLSNRVFEELFGHKDESTKSDIFSKIIKLFIDKTINYNLFRSLLKVIDSYKKEYNRKHDLLVLLNLPSIKITNNVFNEVFNVIKKTDKCHRHDQLEDFIGVSLDLIKTNQHPLNLLLLEIDSIKKDHKKNRLLKKIIYFKKDQKNFTEFAKSIEINTSTVKNCTVNLSKLQDPILFNRLLALEAIDSCANEGDKICSLYSFIDLCPKMITENEILFKKILTMTINFIDEGEKSRLLYSLIDLCPKMIAENEILFKKILTMTTNFIDYRFRDRVLRKLMEIVPEQNLKGLKYFNLFLNTIKGIKDKSNAADIFEEFILFFPEQIIVNNLFNTLLTELKDYKGGKKTDLFLALIKIIPIQNEQTQPLIDSVSDATKKSNDIHFKVVVLKELKNKFPQHTKDINIRKFAQKNRFWGS
ncbi:hypothetical protein ACFLZV_07010 [Candidatus Margulisiibacteriota bacterium]